MEEHPSVGISQQGAEAQIQGFAVSDGCQEIDNR
jgi:hypothetical protein